MPERVGGNCFIDLFYIGVDVGHVLQVWKYQHTQNITNDALEQFNVNIQTPQGHKEANVLLTGGTTGSIR